MGFQDNIPIYVQIAHEIKEQIIAGNLKDGEKIHSVREYSVLYEVTALTVQRAIQLLETEGVIQTKKGVGSFVVPGIQPELKHKMVNTQVQEFVRRMKSMGITNDGIQQSTKEALTDE
jgi:DNA-binding transcriptional regulator YhcF (GntR family)